MYKRYIANSKKCYVIKVTLIELKFFLLILDIPHYDLLKCQINQRHFYNSIFRVTNSYSSMFCVTVANFKLKVQRANQFCFQKMRLVPNTPVSSANFPP